MGELIIDDENVQLIIETYQSHASIKGIVSHVRGNDVLIFDIKPVLGQTILKEISKLNERESTACDLMPPQFVKCQEWLYKPVTTLTYMSIEQSMFPDALKDAELTLVIKRDDNMNKNNFI